MKNKLQIALFFIFISIFIVVFHRWFIFDEIIGGDWPYLFRESLNNYYFLVPSWNAWQGNGFGGTNPIYFLQTFEYLTVFLSTSLHISWPIIYKIFWFGFFILSSILSSLYLVNSVLPKLNILQKLIAIIIFSTNTYVLMLVSGGQMGVALAYSIAPFVLGVFIKLISLISSSDSNSEFKIKNSKLSILVGLALSFQVLLDPRIAYITLIAVVIYAIFRVRNMRNTLLTIFYAFIIPGLITFLLHAFWLLPFLIFSQNTCERFCEAYSGVGIVKFLSFSTFSQGLSLLHPNWSENIFGKIYFMKAEFLIIPVLAYSSILFISSKLKGQKLILIFSLIGILGAFLGKGANSPFGDFYLWMFENVPGFILFRDPTKFYLLVALSYSVLIPFSIYSIYEWVSSKFQPSPRLRPASKIQNYFPVLIFLFFIIYWIISIHPAILGQLGGTFKKHEAPKEYVEFKDFLHKQPEFFRTLWVPRQSRFTFFSNIHPSVEAGALFNATNSAQVVKDIKKKGSQYFSELSIKYVIVPYDNLGEIFQKDRKYDQELYMDTVKGLESISWLKKTDVFGKIQVFEIPSAKDHFWLAGDGDISHKAVNPTHYSLIVSLSSSQKLIFSEKYNPSWVARIEGKTIESQKTSNNLNIFELGKGEYNLEIIFLQDNLYSYGRIISFVTLLAMLIFVIRFRKS